MQKYLTILSFLLFMSCSNDIEQVNALFDESEAAIEKIVSPKIYYSELGDVKVEIIAPVMKNYIDKKNPRNEFPEGIKVVFYNADKTIGSTLTAKYAVERKQEGKIEVRDSVVIHNSDGELFETEQLFWYREKQKVETEQDIKITREDEILEAEGFESNENFSKYKMYKIKSIIYIDKKEQGFD